MAGVAVEAQHLPVDLLVRCQRLRLLLLHPGQGQAQSPALQGIEVKAWSAFHRLFRQASAIAMQLIQRLGQMPVQDFAGAVADGAALRHKQRTTAGGGLGRDLQGRALHGFLSGPADMEVGGNVGGLLLAQVHAGHATCGAEVMRVEQETPQRLHIIGIGKRQRIGAVAGPVDVRIRCGGRWPVVRGRLVAGNAAGGVIELLATICVTRRQSFHLLLQSQEVLGERLHLLGIPFPAAEHPRHERALFAMLRAAHHEPERVRIQPRAHARQVRAGPGRELLFPGLRSVMAGDAVGFRHQEQAAIHHGLVRVLLDVELVKGEDVGMVDRLGLKRMGMRGRREQSGQGAGSQGPITSDEWHAHCEKSGS